jgi:thiamine biosynthesis protein ThiS
MPSDSNLITIRLNGESRSVEHGLAVTGLLEELSKDPLAVAVELNESILPRTDYGKARLAEGDRLEVVQFVQGG